MNNYFLKLQSIITNIIKKKKIIPSNICQIFSFNRITHNTLTFNFFKYIFNASCVPLIIDGLNDLKIIITWSVNQHFHVVSVNLHGFQQKTHCEGSLQLLCWYQENMNGIGVNINMFSLWFFDVNYGDMQFEWFYFFSPCVFFTLYKQHLCV